MPINFSTESFQKKTYSPRFGATYTGDREIEKLINSPLTFEEAAKGKKLGRYQISHRDFYFG